MSSVEILTPLSVEAYLEREKRSDVRHEFIEGYVYAMVGASRRHNLIALSLERRLHAALDDDIERSPKLVVEVLSPSTEARDRMEKRLAYPSLASLEEYVLVAQDRVHVEVYRRQGSAWVVERHGAGDTVGLESADTSFPAEQIYEDVLDDPA